MTPRGLAGFYAAIGPLLEGRAGLADAQRALWPEGAPRPDGDRLAIYARFCHTHRVSALSAYAETRRAAEAAGARWADVVASYFRASPMHHVELNENGTSLPEHLASVHGALPPYLPALADLERWVWRTRVAADDPADAAGGPLRLATTVEARPYAWDLVTWLDDAPRAPAPQPASVIVLFWRDPDGDARRELAAPEELYTLKCVAEGVPVPDAVADTLADLRAAGVVLGG